MLDGTDKAQFTLSATTIAVTTSKPADNKPTRTVTLAMKADASKPALTNVEGECKGMGSSWISLTPG